MGAEDDRPPGSDEARADAGPTARTTAAARTRAGTAAGSGTSERDTWTDDARRRLQLSFDAFDASHHRLWLRYAHTQVGSREAAQSVVEDACRHLMDHWVHALRQPSLTEYAWKVLK